MQLWAILHDFKAKNMGTQLPYNKVRVCVCLCVWEGEFMGARTPLKVLSK